ncbi:MAG: YceI family protein [Balneolaceae bacterium]
MFPKLKFESTNFERVGEDEYKVTGDLTIRDVTKKIELDVVHGGTVSDPYPE